MKNQFKFKMHLYFQPVKISKRSNLSGKRVRYKF